jgi:hypothetical protein
MFKNIYLVNSDLDLYVYLPEGTASSPICYNNKGKLDAFPYVELDNDVQFGYGPETVKILQATPGVYRFFVKAHSKDAPLAGCGAIVRIITRTGFMVYFECPNTGVGDWWYIFDFNFDLNEYSAVNIIRSNVV